MNPLPEKFKVPAIKTFLIALGLLGIMATIAIVLHFWRSHSPHEIPPEKSPHPSPRLQVEFEEGILYQKWKKKEIQDLHSYSWKDSNQEFAKVPIERAMEAFLEADNQGDKK